MPNLAQVLKTEFVRLARRELKKETAALQKASARHRRDIAALKREHLRIDAQVKAMGKRHAKSQVAAPAAGDDANFRFRADGFRTLRKRLGISADNMAKLLGVSGQTVYLWEQKKTTPRRSQLPAIAELRSMGKREVAQRLESLEIKSN